MHGCTDRAQNNSCQSAVSCSNPSYNDQYLQWSAAVLGQIFTYYLQLNYLITVTYYPYNKVTIILLHIILLCVHSLKAVTCEATTLSCDMIVLFDNVQILVSKKLVNKLHPVGFVTLLWLNITQWITNKISNLVTCSNNIM